jgi:hypothetical protein
MFDLKQSMTDWRRQMLAAGIKTPAPLEELESHLHEEIERLVKSGLDEQGAFNAAVQKIGPTPAIRNEFEKVEEERARARRQGRNWRMFEIVFLATALLYPFFVGGSAFSLKNGSFSEMTSSQQMSSLAAAAAFSLLAWGMRLSGGRFPVIHTSRIRDVILLPVALWLVAFASIIMPRCDLTMSQRGVVSLWGFAPFGILVGWLWGMAAARKKVATTVS